MGISINAMRLVGGMVGIAILAWIGFTELLLFEEGNVDFWYNGVTLFLIGSYLWRRRRQSDISLGIWRVGIIYWVIESIVYVAGVDPARMTSTLTMGAIAIGVTVLAGGFYYQCQAWLKAATERHELEAEVRKPPYGE